MDRDAGEGGDDNDSHGLEYSFLSSLQSPDGQRTSSDYKNFSPKERVQVQTAETQTALAIDPQTSVSFPSSVLDCLPLETRLRTPLIHKSLINVHLVDFMKRLEPFDHQQRLLLQQQTARVHLLINQSKR